MLDAIARDGNFRPLQDLAWPTVLSATKCDSELSFATPLAMYILDLNQRAIDEPFAQRLSEKKLAGAGLHAGHVLFHGGFRELGNDFVKMQVFK